MLKLIERRILANDYRAATHYWHVPWVHKGTLLVVVGEETQSELHPRFFMKAEPKLAKVLKWKP
jgi:hypothetical protein